jgi:2-phosphosulfolactate phosphatase
MKVDAVLQPSELPFLSKRGEGDVVCVVFDILRATSSMVAGLAHGVSAIFPVATIEAALELKKRHPQALLGGERRGDRIEGFDLGNSPAEYLGRGGASVIMTTTNGTVALQACAGGGTVLVGALSNLGAVAAAVRRLNPGTLLAVCSGTGDGLALEDAWAAGALVECFPEAEWSDAALTACAVKRGEPDAAEALKRSSNGRALLAKGRGQDIEWCAAVDRFESVGILRDGVVGLLREGGVA